MYAKVQLDQVDLDIISNPVVLYLTPTKLNITNYIHVEMSYLFVKDGGI